MTIKLGAGLVDAAMAYIVANLRTHLDAEQTLWGDGIALPSPNSYVKRDPDQPERLSNPPYLFVFVDNTTIYDWRQDFAMSEHTLVVWHVSQMNEQTSTLTAPELIRAVVNRYGNALFKCLMAFHASQGEYRMASPDNGSPPIIDVGPTLVRESVAMLDVRLETRWTVRESA